MTRKAAPLYAVAMTIALLSGLGVVAAGGSSLCTGAVDEAGPPQCYSPSRVGAAQRAMARTAVPVWPGTVVWNVARLHLTQVELRQPGRPLEIRYLFGTLGKANHPLVDNDLGRRRPHYVLVGELHSSVSGRVDKTTRNTTGAGGSYWTFYTTFRCRSLSLSVTTNEPRRVAMKIGRGILRAEVCHK